MALLPENFLVPKGQFRSAMFPEIDDLDAALQGWIDEAYADTAVAALPDDGTRDAAVKAWVYKVGYFDVYLRLKSNPIKGDVEGQGSATFDKSQADAFKTLSDQWSDILEGLLADDEEEVADDHYTSAVKTKVTY